MADPKVNIILTATDQTGGAMKSATSGLKGILSTALGVAAGTILPRIPGMLMDVGKAAMDLVRDSASLETVRQAFEGIAESAGFSSDVMLKALQDQSNGMITNADLMKSFNSAAQLVSKDFATRLPDAFKYLGKVSMAQLRC